MFQDSSKLKQTYCVDIKIYGKPSNVLNAFLVFYFSSMFPMLAWQNVLNMF